MWLTLEQTNGLSQVFPLAPSLVPTHHTEALAKVESSRSTLTRQHARRESALRMSHRPTLEDFNSENQRTAVDDSQSPGIFTLPKLHYRTHTSPDHQPILQMRSDNIQTIPRNRTTSALTPESHKITQSLDFSPLTPRQRPTPAPETAAATPSPSSAQAPCRPPKSIHRLTPKTAAGSNSCSLQQANPIAFLSSNSPLQDFIDRAQASAPDPSSSLIRSDSESTLGKQPDYCAHMYIPTPRRSSLMPRSQSSNTSSRHLFNTMLPVADHTNPASVKYFVPYINSPGLGEESGTDEFASAEEGDESVWTGEHETDVDESFERMQRWAQSDTINLEQPVILPMSQSRPSLPHHWTAQAEDVQTEERKAESRARVPSCTRQLSDHTPEVSHSIKPHEPSLNLNQPTSQTMGYRSGRLTSIPVTRSLSKVFGGAELTDPTSIAGKAHSISERPRLRTSSSARFLGFRSSSSHSSRPRYSTVHHSTEPVSESGMLGAFEMPSRPLNTPFLTPTYTNSDVDPGPQSAAMVRTFSAIGGLAATRSRQLTDERRSSSNTTLRQISNLFHPRSRDSSFDGTNGHFVRPKIHSVLSTHSISTLASTTASVSLTWRNTVAGEEYERLVAEHGSMEMRRQEVIWELCQTEEAFISSLRTVIETFVNPLRRADKQWISDVPPRVSSLFESLEEIINMHTQISEAIKPKEEKLIVEHIADRWLSYVPKLEVHQSYLANFEGVNRLLEEMIGDRSSDFGEFVRMQSELDSCGKMSLSSFLLKPVQRLMKYPLFFKQLRDLTPPMHVDHLSTIALLEATDDIIRVMQEVKGREDDYLRAKTLESQIKQSPLPGGLKLAIRDRKLIGQGVLKQVHVSSSNRLAPPHRQREPRPVSQFSNESEFGGSNSTRTDCSSSCSDEPPKTPSDQYEHFLNSPDLGPPSPPSLARKPSRLTAPGRFLAGGGAHKDSKVSVFVFTDVMLVLSTRGVSDTLMRKRTSSRKGSTIEYQVVDEIGICKIIGVEDRSGDLGYERLIKVRVCPLMSSEQQREQVVHFAVEEEKEFGKWMGWMERSGLTEVRREEVKTLARSRSVREAAGISKAAPEERTWWKERFRIVRSEMTAAEHHAR